MEHDVLKLCAGTAEAERGGMPGVSLRGKTRFACSAEQAAVLRALYAGGRTVEELLALLRGMEGPTAGAETASLALAGFILDFEDYLEP